MPVGERQLLEPAELTPQERQLCDKAGEGEPLDLRGRKLGHDRQVRAQVLLQLLTGQGPKLAAMVRAVLLRGAAIVGPLDLSGLTLRCPLELYRCYLGDAVDLAKAEAFDISLRGSRLEQGLSGYRLQLKHDLNLTDGFRCRSQLDLPGARIGGQLDLSGATLTNEGGEALLADRLVVDGDVVLSDATVTGQVRLVGARVGGQLNCRRARVISENKDKRIDREALVADLLTVNGGISLSGTPAEFNGEVRLAKFDGEVRLSGARITGKLDCSDAELKSGPRPGARALDAEGVIVHGDVCLQAKFEGEVRLSGAHIVGQLDCVAAWIENWWGLTLNAVGLVVDRDVYLKSRYDGEVRLSGARITGRLDCSHGKPLPTGGRGPQPGERLRNVSELVLLGPGTGSVRISDYHGASFSFSKQSVTHQKAALNLQRVFVGQDVLMCPNSFNGELDLHHAKVGVWKDEKCTWPKPGGVHLDGFVYDSIDGDGDPKGRLRDWLPRDNDYAAQPYEQLAGVYRREGDESGARAVAIGKQQARRAAVTGWMRGPSRLWSAVLRWTIGYGYRPALALIPLAVLILIGSALFDIASHNHPKLLHPAKSGPEQPSFNAFRYTLDLLLPVVDFKQRDAFVAGGWAAWAAFGFIFAGWLLAAIIVAGLTGIFKRD